MSRGNRKKPQGQRPAPPAADAACAAVAAPLLLFHCGPCAPTSLVQVGQRSLEQQEVGVAALGVVPRRPLGLRPRQLALELAVRGGGARIGRHG